MTTKTPAEIEQLKTNWLNDPCWDIETTEGFEAHTEELKAFHDEQRVKWIAALKAKEDARRVRTIYQRLDGGSTAAQDTLESELLAEGWQIINVSVVAYIDPRDDHRQPSIDRYITFQR